MTTLNLHSLRRAIEALALNSRTPFCSLIPDTRYLNSSSYESSNLAFCEGLRRVLRLGLSLGYILDALLFQVASWSRIASREQLKGIAHSLVENLVHCLQRYWRELRLQLLRVGRKDESARQLGSCASRYKPNQQVPLPFARLLGLCILRCSYFYYTKIGGIRDQIAGIRKMSERLFCSLIPDTRSLSPLCSLNPVPLLPSDP